MTEALLGFLAIFVMALLRMPLAFSMGLVGVDGRYINLHLEGHLDPIGHNTVLVLSEPSQTFTFVHVPVEPVPSLLRGFSAPVVLETELSDDALFVLLSHDHDPFNRWEAGQKLALRRILSAVHGNGHIELDARFIDAMRSVLRHDELDAAFKELVLTLPSEAYVAEQLDVVDPQRIHTARERIKLQLAHALHADWEWAYAAHHDSGAYSPDAVSSGRRALANLALSMLVLDAVARHNQIWPGKALQRFKDATNMTDRLGSLAALVNAHSELAAGALERFHAQFKNEALVIDKWFTLQVTAPEHEGQVFARAKALMLHPDFTLRTPNRARSLLMALCQSNPAAFHRQDAAGYVFWADRVLELARAARDAVRAARRRARAKLGWLLHAAVYLVVNTGLVALSLAGGQWSPSRFRDHCLQHIDEDFSSCVGFVTLRRGDGLDALKAWAELEAAMAPDEGFMAYDREMRLAPLAARALRPACVRLSR